jgi:tRNA dimethylallyltransferase
VIPEIAVIAGPTATGKTALGVALAKQIGGEIVSADSMQIYKHMDIGTAKPTAEETGGVRHHMIDIVSPFETYSVARYVEDAARCVDDILERGKQPVVVGGTGLYIESLIRGRAFAEQGDAALRREISERYDRLGGAALLKELGAFDRKSAERLHPNDKKRIVRALEIYALTGMTLTEHDEMTKKQPPRYGARILALTYSDRAELYGHIDRRVDRMMEKGLVGEVRKLLNMGLGKAHTAMQAIGYKEIADALTAGGDLETAVQTIKTESRRYAKRQLSWFKRDKNIRWIEWEKEPDFAAGLRISTEYLE